MACDHEIEGCDCAGARDAEIERLRAELERVRGALSALAGSVTVTSRSVTVTSRPVTPDSWRRFWATGWKARYIALLEQEVGPLPAPPAKGQTIAAEKTLSVFKPEDRIRAIELYFSINDRLAIEKCHPLGLLQASLPRIVAAMNGKAPASPTAAKALVGQNTYVPGPEELERIRAAARAGGPLFED